MIDTVRPHLAKAVWIDRCVMHLGKLKPEISLLEAQTVTMNILWSEDREESPEKVASEWAREPAETD